MEQVTWANLSPRGQSILRTVAIPLSLGCSLKQVATQLGIPGEERQERADALEAVVQAYAAVERVKDAEVQP